MFSERQARYEQQVQTQKVNVFNKDVEQEMRSMATDWIKEKMGLVVENRAMTTMTNQNLVAEYIYKEVYKKLDEVSPLFNRINFLPSKSGSLKLFLEDDLGEAFFIGEMENIVATDFTLKEKVLNQVRCGTALIVSQQLINDAEIDIIEYIADVLARRVAKALNKSILIGDGTVGNQFEGLINTTKEYTFKEQNPNMDDFINIVNAMHPTLQHNAIWIMNRPLFNEISLLKDGNGNYFMTRQLNVVDNRPEYKLLGHDVLISEDLETNTTGCGIYTNLNEGLFGMIKKGAEFKHITQDTLNAFRGSHTFTLDIYADTKIKNENAIIKINRKTGGQE